MCCSSNCFAERLVAFAAVEGIFFSGRYSLVKFVAGLSVVYAKQYRQFVYITLGFRISFALAVSASFCVFYMLTCCVLVQLLQYLLAEEAWLHAWTYLLQ